MQLRARRAVTNNQRYALQLIEGYDERVKMPCFQYVLFRSNVLEALSDASAEEWRTPEHYGVVVKKGYGRPSDMEEREAISIYENEYLRHLPA
ncbi:MAG: hypothetical protein H6908_01975 [Hyphomicrobiales bacterium]|nr:hypothetical protein [Hyphomicrobiales bacterium]